MAVYDPTNDGKIGGYRLQTDGRQLDAARRQCFDSGLTVIRNQDVLQGPQPGTGQIENLSRDGRSAVQMGCRIRTVLETR